MPAAGRQDLSVGFIGCRCVIADLKMLGDG
jgi:hypothetical protein